MLSRSKVRKIEQYREHRLPSKSYITLWLRHYVTVTTTTTRMWRCFSSIEMIQILSWCLKDASFNSALWNSCTILTQFSWVLSNVSPYFCHWHDLYFNFTCKHVILFVLLFCVSLLYHNILIYFSSIFSVKKTFLLFAKPKANTEHKLKSRNVCPWNCKRLLCSSLVHALKKKNTQKTQNNFRTLVNVLHACHA